MNLLDILLQRSDGSTTPRLDDLKREEIVNRVGVREGQVETPDLKNIDELEVREADVPEETSGIIDDILGGQFKIEFGRAFSDESKGWYEVQFDKSYSDPPVVIGVIENRSGDPQTGGNYTAPEQDSANDKFVSIDAFNFQNSVENQFKKQTREIGKKSFNVIKDQINTSTPIPDFVENPLQNFLIDLYDSFFTLTLGYGRDANDEEGVVESIMGAIGSFVGNGIDDGLQARGDEIRDAMGIVRGYKDDNAQLANWGFQQVSNQVETAYESTPTALYDALGVPGGTKIAPFHHRNVTENKFEFLGYEGGVTVHWVAISS